MKITLTRAATTASITALTLLSACSFLHPEKTGQTSGQMYTVTIKNTLPGERIAPILIVANADDSKIWIGKYVSAEARTQFTTGNPGPLAKILGGDQGQPGKVGVDGQVTFTFTTTAATARLTAMVHPDKTPDNYVTTLIDLRKGGVFELVRFDIGDDEERRTVQQVSSAGSVTVSH